MSLHHTTLPLQNVCWHSYKVLGVIQKPFYEFNN